MTKQIKLLFGLGLLLLLAMRCAIWFAQTQVLPVCVEHQPHRVVIVVERIDSVPGNAATLAVRILELQSAGCKVLLGKKIRLSWREPKPTVAAGTQMSADIVLRKPWGSVNPGGFDYGLWLHGQGYFATGYIKSIGSGEQSAELRHRLRINSKNYVHADLLNAVVLGDRSTVSSSQWALFRATGTIHLMVVSGLHVGVFTGLLYIFLYNGLRLMRLPAARWLPRSVAITGSLIGLGLLVYQTGAHPPVLRAVLMAACISLAVLSLRTLSWWQCLSSVAGLAIVVQPQIIVQYGFWLSYAAVASLLFYFTPRTPQWSSISGLVICQAVLWIALVPWLGMLVGDVPLVAPIANLLVVPIITLVTIPFGMSGAILSVLPYTDTLVQVLLGFADFSLMLVLAVLNILQTATPSIGYFPTEIAVCALCSASLLLMPVSRKIRLLAMFGWLPLVLAKTTGVDRGEFRVQILDVGQGSSAIVDTQHHRVVIDAGAAFPSGFNIGSAVVIPTLRATGPDHIDKLLISHSDNDHAGGASALSNRYPYAEVIGLKMPCEHESRFTYDGVNFLILVDTTAKTTNDRSCTLLVSNSKKSAFLSGDISHKIELRLLERLPRSVDLLIAPHHGSTTSSSLKFVRHLQPEYVVFSAGRRNRYKHPRPEVVRRYLRLGATTFKTSETGAVTWSSNADVVSVMR